MPDTTTYIREADAAISSALGTSTIWSDKKNLYLPRPYREAFKGGGNSRERFAQHPPLLGRSIYYGLFIYAPAVLLDISCVVILQSALTSLVIWLSLIPALEKFSSGSRNYVYLAICGILAVGTPLPFEVSMVMPDFLTGVGVLAFASLLCFWQRYRAWQRALLSASIVLATISHSSNVLVVAALALFALACLAGKMAVSKKTLVVAVVAITFGLAGDWLFSAAVDAKIGIEPIRPPFLTARLIADGPGHRWMKKNCSVSDFAVCQYMARTPNDSDAFLWSTSKKDGVFSAVDLDMQRQISNQDASFAFFVLKDYPIETSTSSIRAFFRQILLFNYGIWRGDNDHNPFEKFSNFPSSVRRELISTKNATGIMTIEPFQKMDLLIYIFFIINAILFQRNAMRSEDINVRSYSIAIFSIFFSIIVNSLVTGVLSKPVSRYNLRIVWTLPLILMSLWAYLISLRASPISNGSDDVKNQH